MPDIKIVLEIEDFAKARQKTEYYTNPAYRPGVELEAKCENEDCFKILKEGRASLGSPRMVGAGGWRGF